MRIDEAGRNNQTVRLDRRRGGAVQPSDGGDTAAGDPDIGLHTWCPGAVDDRPVADQKIEFHAAPSRPHAFCLRYA